MSFTSNTFCFFSLKLATPLTTAAAEANSIPPERKYSVVYITNSFSVFFKWDVRFSEFQTVQKLSYYIFKTMSHTISLKV